MHLFRQAEEFFGQRFGRGVAFADLRLHFFNRPEKIDRRGARGAQHPGRPFERLTLRIGPWTRVAGGGQGHSVARRYPDGGRAAHHHALDGLGHLLFRAAFEINLIKGKFPLIDQDERAASKRDAMEVPLNLFFLAHSDSLIHNVTRAHGILRHVAQNLFYLLDAQA